MDVGKKVLFNAKSKKINYICSIAVCIICESIFFSFFILLTIGPPLPNKLAAHSSLEINGDLFVFGGQDETGYPQSAIHQLTCSSGICRWSTVNQSLKVARPKLIAIPVPDIFCT